MAVTLKEIAEVAGVTKTVVSEVLRDRPSARRFSAATRERVLKVAESLNYQPNFFAKQLMRQNRRTLMLALSSLNDTFVMPIAQGFEQAAAKRGYNVMFSILSHQQQADSFERVLGPQGILGLAVVAWSSAPYLSDARLTALAEAGVHIVTIGREVTTTAPICQIDYDNESAVRGVIDSLAAQGARRFWLVGRHRAGNDAGGIITLRCEMAAAYLAGLGLPEPRVLEVAGHDPEAGFATVSEALAGTSAPEAICCGADPLAWGSCRALREHGLTVGVEVAVTGFNDSYGSAYMTPALTTVRIPAARMGAMAADMLIEDCQLEPRAERRRSVDTELIMRESGCVRQVNRR